jgi:hypothetical protein
MDNYAILTLEHHLSALVASMSDYVRQFYGHADTAVQGDISQVRDPRVIVAVPGQRGSIGYPKGPATDIPHVDTTEVAVYVETPLFVLNPAGNPDEVDGYLYVHLPLLDVIRQWVHDNGGLEVPSDIQILGAPVLIYGMWFATPQESMAARASHYTHVFHIMLQKQEVS